MIDSGGSCSAGRLPSLQIEPDNFAFGVFLDSKAYDLVTVWDVDLFAFPWCWKDFRVDSHVWILLSASWIGPFKFFAIFCKESNLSEFTSCICKLFWALDGWDLVRTFEKCSITECSIQCSISNWGFFAIEQKIDALSEPFATYLISVRIDLLQVEALQFK